MSTTSKLEIKELIEELSRRFDKVREKAEFLNLKGSEQRAGDFISQTMFMDANEELRIEQSLLAGHAFMVQQLACERNMKLDRDTTRLLRRIQNHAFNNRYSGTTPGFGM